MKKLILTLWLAAAATATFAQHINLGVKAGLNFSDISYSENYPVTKSSLTGFHAGVIVDFGMGDFSIQPGVFFITKGHQFRAQLAEVTGSIVTTSSVTYKIKLNYLEIPVNLLYNIRIVPTVFAYLGGGPYLGYGLSGSSSGGGQSADIKFGPSGDGNSYRNPDYGLNFVAGIKANNILVDLNYGLGLGNLSYFPGEKFHNRVIGLSLGYLFK